jgi:hypothetical protein
VLCSSQTCGRDHGSGQVEGDCQPRQSWSSPTRRLRVVSIYKPQRTTMLVRQGDTNKDLAAVLAVAPPLRHSTCSDHTRSLALSSHLLLARLSPFLHGPLSLLLISWLHFPSGFLSHYLFVPLPIPQVISPTQHPPSVSLKFPARTRPPPCFFCFIEKKKNHLIQI